MGSFAPTQDSNDSRKDEGPDREGSPSSPTNGEPSAYFRPVKVVVVANEYPHPDKLA